MKMIVHRLRNVPCLILLFLMILIILPETLLANSISGTLSDTVGLINGSTNPVFVEVFVNDACNSPQQMGSGAVQTDGSYSVGGLADGAYFVQTNHGDQTNLVNEWWASGASIVDCAGAQAVNITSGTPMTGVNFQLAAGGMISGQISDGSSGILNVCVHAQSDRCDRQNQNVGNSQTDAGGNYQIVGIPIGTSVYVSTNTACSSGNYTNAWWNAGGGTSNCGAAEGAADGRTDINFTLQMGGYISGTVTGPGGPVPNLWVHAQDGACDGTFVGNAQTDVDGNYTISNVPPGPVYVQTCAGCTGLNLVEEWYDAAQGTTDCSSAAPVDVVATQASGSVNFSLEASGSVAGTVTSSGQPLADVCVTAFADSCGQNWMGGMGTDSGGNYQINGLPAGDYYLFVEPDCNYPQNYVGEWYDGDQGVTDCNSATGANVVASQTLDVDFSLEAGGSITGTVISGGQFLADVCVTAFAGPCGQNWMGGMGTDGSGNYQIDSLPAGDYFLYFDADCNYPQNYLNEWYNDIPDDYCEAATAVSVTAGTPTPNINATLEAGFPMNAQLMNIHQPDGTFDTYYSIGPVDFAGNLPGDINSITITTPTSRTISLTSAEWDPVWKEFAIVEDGSPEPGVYTFTVVSGGITVAKTDYQYQVRTLPLPETAKFSPAPNAVLGGKTPTFTWQAVDYPGIPLYYRFEVVDDTTGQRAWASKHERDMLHYTVTEGKLLAGGSYRWRVRVTDSDDWIEMQNRANSAWQFFTMAPSLSAHAAVPALDPDSFGTGTYRTEEVNLENWIKVVDYDGVAYNYKNETSSHTVTVTYHGETTPRDLSYVGPAGPYAAYFEFWDRGNSTPANGTYTYEVTDPEGNTATFGEVFTLGALDAVDEASLQPSLKNPTAHYINATFDNILIDGAPFDNFDGYSNDIAALDLTKWRPWHSNEDIVNNALEFDVRDTVGRGHGGIAFVEPDVQSVQADITVNSISENDGPAKARIAGYFFNDGVADVYATLSVNGSRVYYGLSRDWFNEQNTYTWSELASGNLPLAVTPGQTVVGKIEWTGTSLTFSAWDPASPGTVYSSPPYTPAVAYPPINPDLNLQARINLTTNTTPTFQWAKVSNATRYRVRIYNWDRSVTVWKGNAGDTTSITVPPGNLRPDAYYCYRVEARDGHDGLWSGVDDWGIDNMSRTPASGNDFYKFYTGSAEAQDPFIDLDSSGVETWTEEFGGTFLSFWIKVHDAQGVPGNIDTVAVDVPGLGLQTLYFDAANGYNTSTVGIYRSLAFPATIPPGSYTFTVVDKDGNSDTKSDTLTDEPVSAVDPSSITALLNGTAVNFNWDDIVGPPPVSYDPAFYRVEIYDEDYKRIYAFCTTASEYQLAEGFLAPGTFYRYRITARGEFFDENVDNGSSSPWTGEEWPTFITGPVAAGSSPPQIDTGNWGAAVMQFYNPATDSPGYLLSFEVDVTDADGVPANIASVIVTYPDGITTRELHFEESISATEGRYSGVEIYTNPDLIPTGPGFYTFTVTDADSGTDEDTDDLTKNLLDFPANCTPLPDTVLTTGTRPVFSWNPVSGAVSYQVRIYNGWNQTLHRSDHLVANTYTLPYGILEGDTTYSYRVYAYRENYPTDDLDNFSANIVFSSHNYHFTTTADPDSDGDGLPDMIETGMCSDSADGDSDEDGIADGIEDANGNGVLDSGETDPCNADSDGDGIQDGTEIGLTAGTVDTNPGIFVPDADNSTTTDPLNSDSDGDQLNDGEEDTNFNGRLDAGESDPNTSDIPDNITMPWIQLLLLEE